MEVKEDLNFDNDGNLMPYKKSVLDIESFYSMFVKDFNDSSTRSMIFKNYISYIEDLYSLTEIGTFVQYVGGSFVTNKLNPSDIDIVNLINVKLLYKIGKEKREILFNKFLSKHNIGDMRTEGKSKELYEVDAFLIPVFPKNDKRFETESLVRIKSWKQLLSFAKNHKPTGYIQITYDKETLEKLSALKGCL